MTNKQILTKAIKKAIKNGWKRGEIIIEVIESGKSFDIGAVTRNMFFTHNFAKAFWGDSGIVKIANIKMKVINGYWEYELQQLVLEEEPLKYIKKFL